MSAMPKPRLEDVLGLIDALAAKTVADHLTAQRQQDQGIAAERTKPVPLRDLDKAA